jgi:hypothetical protein
MRNVILFGLWKEIYHAMSDDWMTEGEIVDALALVETRHFHKELGLMELYGAVEHRGLTRAEVEWRRIPEAEWRQKRKLSRCKQKT